MGGGKNSPHEASQKPQMPNCAQRHRDTQNAKSCAVSPDSQAWLRRPLAVSGGFRGPEVAHASWVPGMYLTAPPSNDRPAPATPQKHPETHIN